MYIHILIMVKRCVTDRGRLYHTLFYMGFYSPKDQAAPHRVLRYILFFSATCRPTLQSLLPATLTSDIPETTYTENDAENNEIHQKNGDM